MTRTLWLVVVSALLCAAPGAHGATLTSFAVLIGNAYDVEYDGIFETLRDVSSAPQYSVAQVGRVIGGDNQAERRTILEFRIDDIPIGAPVTAATLSMDFVSGSTERGVYAAYGRVGDGLLSTADATATATLAGAQPGSYQLSIDVRAFVEDLVAGGASWAGFTVVEWIDDVNSNFEVDFGPDRPKLTIDYVPEPGAGAGGAVALAALIASIGGGRRNR